MNIVLYKLSAYKNVGKVGDGSSNPDRYTNCTEFTKRKTCTEYAQENCQSFIVKNGIGDNHEFIDVVIASLFLNSPSIKSSTLFPENGYKIIQNSASVDIIGSVSLEICEFKTIKDIFKKYDTDFNGEVNIRKTSVQTGAYITALKEYLKNTKPESIVAYFILQFISGGGDPNPGNFGFVKNLIKTSDYKYLLAKVDLGASFKRYSDEVTGDKPTLEFNRYAFEIPVDITNFSELYSYITQNGRILMPGEAYSSQKPSHIKYENHLKTEEARKKAKKVLGMIPRQGLIGQVMGLKPSTFDSLFSGRSDAGFYSGQYPDGTTGVNIQEYIKIEHLENFVQDFCADKKRDTINKDLIESQQSVKGGLESTTQWQEVQSLLKDTEEKIVSWDVYMEQINTLVISRYDRVCTFVEKEKTVISNKQQDHSESEVTATVEGNDQSNLVGKNDLPDDSL